MTAKRLQGLVLRIKHRRNVRTQAGMTSQGLRARLQGLHGSEAALHQRELRLLEVPSFSRAIVSVDQSSLLRDG